MSSIGQYKKRLQGTLFQEGVEVSKTTILFNPEAIGALSLIILCQYKGCIDNIRFQPSSSKDLILIEDKLRIHGAKEIMIYINDKHLLPPTLPSHIAPSKQLLLEHCFHELYDNLVSNKAIETEKYFYLFNLAINCEAANILVQLMYYAGNVELIPAEKEKQIQDAIIWINSFQDTIYQEITPCY